jgi:serine/threonine protein kinase/tetratricopeptide (TPR) repeat protein
MPLSSGTHLGTYHITGLLGAGAMGEVYRARDTRLKRDVAIKVLPASVAGDPDRLVRFEREARTIAGLNHPNIVTLFSVEDEGDVRFLTMELVEGQSLDRVVTPGGLPLARVLELSIPLANALVAAHERGVIHRDLKPANVMVTHDDWIKVLDFGLAKVTGGEDPPPDATVGATTDASPSGEGQVLGTVPYMAPEQIRSETVDARSDLFALGIIMYELATGRRPFAGSSPADVTASILRDAPVPAASVRPDLPRDLNRIITRCLEKKPRDRFQTARDLYNDLRYVQREIESGATAMTPGSAPSPDSGHGPGFGGAREASIAVLPFVNRSRDEEDEYFSDGLADELLNVLTKVRGLRVAARASSFQFKGKNEDVAVIGERLNTATLLDGSVRKSGNRVRISVQLVKAADRVQLWSETYDRSLEDIFAVQDDIAQCVVKQLRETLLGEAPGADASRKAEADIAAAATGHGTNPEAHRLYLQGKYLIARVTQEDTIRGLRYLNEALALDPTHALAWVEVARAHALTGGYGWESTSEGYRKAREAAMRAIGLAPELAEGYLRLSAVQRLHDWDWKAAEVSTRRALELAPGDAEVMRSAAGLLHLFGRYDEAERLFRSSVEKDPLSSSGYRLMALLYRSMDRLEDAEQAIRKSIEMSRSHVSSQLWLAVVLSEQGRNEEALVEAKAETAEWASLTALAIVHFKAGRRTESDQALAELEAKHFTRAPYQIATVRASRGEVDAAFSWLDRGIAEKDSGVVQSRCERIFRGIHQDPRWIPLMRKLGLES